MTDLHTVLFASYDVELLREASSEEIKVDLIKKLHDNFKFGNLTNAGRLVAEEILRLLANDISIRIRHNISLKFCDNLALPNDIALLLANDLENIVALPILQNCLILNDSDLIKIIETSNSERQQAIAMRRQISEELCNHIISRATPPAIEKLIANDNINLSVKQSEWLIAMKNQPILHALIINKKIHIEQVYELLAKVSGDLQKMLIVQYQIPNTVVNNLVHNSKEWVVMNLILSHSEKRSKLSLRQIIEQLHISRDLTFSLLVKALSLGDVTFFEAALAKLANIPLENAQKLIGNDSFTSFKALYDKCYLPSTMAHAIYKLVLIAKEEKRRTGSDEKIYQRILANLSKSADNKIATNLDYLVTVVDYSLRKANLL